MNGIDSMLKLLSTARLRFPILNKYTTTQIGTIQYYLKLLRKKNSPDKDTHFTFLKNPLKLLKISRH